MERDEITRLVLSLPEVAVWDEMSSILEQALTHSNQVWQWPLMACQAVGGDSSSALPCAGAALCMMLAISLVDDMLDEDPRGAYRQKGWAATANLALAFQAAAFRLIGNARITIEQQEAVTANLAQMALTTAYGQNLDVQNLSTEHHYWKVVRAKSTPYYEAVLAIGAIFGNASPEVVISLREVGILCGEIVQLHDDLQDALRVPANPDWRRGCNNILILYASQAEHPARERFRALLGQIDDPKALHEAQGILVRSGAVSYCIYHVVKRYQAAQQVLSKTALVDPTPLERMLTAFIQPVIILFEHMGVALPPELQVPQYENAP